MADQDPEKSTFMRALAEQQKGRHLVALTLFLEAIEEGDESVSLYLALSHTHAALGQFPEAQDACTLAMQSQAKDPEIAASIAQSFEAIDASEQAVEAWIYAAHCGHREAGQALIRTLADPPESVLALAERLCEEGVPEPAIAVLRHSVLNAPDAHAHWSLLAKTCLDQQQHMDAITAASEALKLAPDSLEDLLTYGISCRLVGRTQDALDAFQGVLDTHPTHVATLCALGETLRIMGKFEEALSCFEIAVAQPDVSAAARTGAGACLNALGRYEEALPSWHQSLALEPDQPFARRGLAHCRAALERGAAASRKGPVSRRRHAPTEATAQTGNPSESEHVQTEIERGRSFYKEKNYGPAAQCFERALKLEPSHAEAALRLGMAYEDDRRFREAIEAYERCLKIDDRNYQAATNIGEAHRKNERYQDALSAYDRALKLMPDYLYALAGLAECKRMLGHYEDSLSWFDRALKAGPRHAFAVQGKAAALNALQRYEQALPYWDKALEIEPHSEFAQEGRTFCLMQLKRNPIDPTEVLDEPESATPTLDAQARDLTQLASEGKLPLIVGRDQEIHSVMKTLVRKLKANPLLLGEPGVGKTAVIEGLAQVLASDQAPERLKGLRLFELSIGSLVAGTKYRGTFEERLREVVKEASDNPEVILFIDEIHTLVGAGRTEGGSLDAANILKPALARGEITVIGATTFGEYRKHFESDSALDRRFQPIHIHEPSEPNTLELLRKVQPSYSQHHQVQIEEESLRACVALSVRYLPERRLPDKALDLLDESCAEASLSGLDRVTPAMVARVVSQRTGVPDEQLSEAEQAKLDGMEDALGSSVLGQGHAIRQLSSSVRLARSGLRDNRRPRGVFLAAGGSGVGKTELARKLADYLFPEGDALIRLDMSEYGEKFTTSRLVGAPPGYSGHGEEGLLTGPLRNKPYAVVLLDEFEKAHPDVQAMFLSLFDEGRLTDSEGREVHAKEAYFILTTNLVVQEAHRGPVGFGGASQDSAEERRERVMEHLKERFRPEMLNRMDDLIVFNSLDTESLEGIVRIQLEQLKERASSAGVQLTWTPEVVPFIAQWNADVEWGARSVIRAVDTLVGEPLGEQMVARGGAGASPSFVATLQSGQLHLTQATPSPQCNQPDPEEPVAP